MHTHLSPGVPIPSVGVHISDAAAYIPSLNFHVLSTAPVDGGETTQQAHAAGDDEGERRQAAVRSQQTQ